MAYITSKDGTQIAFDRSGSGPAIILVDGAFCHRAFGPMKPLTPFLEPHFTVIAYDRRGRGESGDTLPYAVEREVEDIDALIQEVGGEAFLYGTSSGAALVLEAAAHGLNVKKMALYEPPFNSDSDALQRAADYTARLNELLAAGKRGDAAALFMSYVGTPEEAIAGAKQSPAWGALESVAPTLAYDNAILGTGAVPTGKAATVTVPTLLLTGGATIPFMHETARALAASMPNAEHRVIEGQTHDIQPDAIAPVLIEFFKA
ncbi:MAG TPA: alpha/beta hydrolase [Spirillospora sp.]|nr:alpha/beta hydrolase [Spirillospora sp.]